MSGRALVTGGAGFIGSHLVDALLRDGWSVRVLDDFSTGKETNLASVRDRVEIVRGDCADAATANRAVGGCDAVFHHAAIASVQLSIEDPARVNRVNVDGTLALLDAARRATSPRVSRFVFAGSSSAYGNGDDSAKKENQRTEALSPYAAAKLAGEQYAKAFAASYGLHTIVLRYFNVFGPRQDPSSPYSGVISVFASSLLAGRSPRIYGDGEQTRDFVCVHDVTAANLKAALAPIPAGSVINIASGRRTSINELYRLVRDSAGSVAKNVLASPAPARAGEIRHSLADVSQARRLLDWNPVVPLDRGIQETVDWYRKEMNS